MVLNEHVTPVGCQVHWVVCPSKKFFSGSCTWQLSVDGPTKIVKCHALGLVLDSVKLAQYKKPQKIESVDRAADGGVAITLAEELQEGRAVLTFSFHGEIKGTVGIHFSGTDSVVQTHFEVSHARKAFPCFDIPNIRATYKVTVTLQEAPPTTRIFSCMPQQSSRSKGTEKTVEFFETPPIPVYVLAFIAFPHNVTTLSEDVTLPSGAVIPVTASISPNPKYPLELLLRAAVYGVKECSEWTGIDYPLPKLDVVVVPKLCLGGMENHGLAFIDGAETSPGKGKKGGNDSTVELVMHEVAHMWMGNMVGLEFWAKEGLAQFFEKVLADGFLGRSSSLPTETKFTAAPVEIEKKAEKKVAKPKPKAKGKKNKKQPEEVQAVHDTDAIDDHDVFNGAMYTKSFLWTVGVERKLGRQEFLKRLTGMLLSNTDLYVSKEMFMEAFGADGL